MWIDRRRPRATRAAVALGVLLVAAGGAFTYYRTAAPPPLKSAALGPAPTVSVIQAGKEVAAPKRPVVVVQAPQPVPVKLDRSLDPKAKAELYKALTAPGATPEMLSKAHQFAVDCMNERASDQYQLEHTGQPMPPRPLTAQTCGLGPGDPDNVTWKRILEARVALNAYGAVYDVSRARTTAFADDPEGWKRLYKEGMRKGVEGAEPVALTGAAVTAEGDGDYRKAAVLYVASAIGRAKEAGKTSVNLDAEPHVAQAMSHIPADQRQQVVIEGQELSNKWKKPY